MGRNYGNSQPRQYSRQPHKLPFVHSPVKPKRQHVAIDLFSLLKTTLLALSVGAVEAAASEGYRRLNTTTDPLPLMPPPVLNVTSSAMTPQEATISNELKIGLAVGFGVGVPLCIVLCVLILYYCKKNKKEMERRRMRQDDVRPLAQTSCSIIVRHPPPAYSLPEMPCMAPPLERDRHPKPALSLTAAMRLIQASQNKRFFLPPARLIRRVEAAQTPPLNLLPGSTQHEHGTRFALTLLSSRISPQHASDEPYSGSSSSSDSIELSRFTPQLFPSFGRR